VIPAEKGIMPNATRLAAALALTATLVLGASASAEAAKLKLGIYDCWAYDYYTGFSNYQSSVKLKAEHKYEHSFGRKDKKLTDASKGTWKIKRGKIKFRKGGMAKTPGKIHPKDASHKDPYFVLLLDGEESGLSCYRVRNP
jgi:hypothetical protein